MSLTFWQGSREFVTTTLVDEQPQPHETLTEYDVTFIPLGASIESALWAAVTIYDGDLGIWVEPSTPVGTYFVYGRAGDGAPNERSIQRLGVFSVRSR